MTMQTRGKALSEGSPASRTRLRIAADSKKRRLMATTLGVQLPKKEKSLASPSRSEPIRLPRKKALDVSSALSVRFMSVLDTHSPPPVSSDARNCDVGDCCRSGVRTRSSSRRRTLLLGESSSRTPNVPMCTICMEPRSPSESFGAGGCSHVYCVACVKNYLVSKIQEKACLIHCPDPVCKAGTFEPEMCRDLLNAEQFEQWCALLCESVVLGPTRFYCPFKDCSAPLLNDGGEGIIRESECPYCYRLFCAQCKVPWHADISCEEYQKRNHNKPSDDDVKLLKLAKDKKWQRCPKCKFIVERTQGCRTITCRCGYLFCYGCGNRTKENHYCSTCRC